MGVHNSDFPTTMRGLYERVYYVKEEGVFVPPPKPQHGAINKALRGFRNRLVRRLPSLSPLSTSEFLSFYRSHKLTRYTRAAESLDEQPVQRKDSFLSTFVKAEKLNLTSKIDPVPRLIQPRNARYNLAVGRFIKAVEHKIYTAIGRIYGEVTVAKGLNADERGQLLHRKWRKFKKPVAIGLDVSRFDQCVSRAALEWEHEIYLECFNYNRLLRKLLRWQVQNVGYIRTPDGMAKYNVDGGRCSGDMNTALGNCLIMCALIHSYVTGKDIKKFEVINDGDDAVLIIEDRSMKKLSDVNEWFRNLGFRMKVEKPVHIFEQVEFCQAQPVLVDGKYRMVRNPIIAMSKDLCSIQGMQNKGDWEYLTTAISHSGNALSRGVPVVQAFYTTLD
jgi:hypothetical protein